MAGLAGARRTWFPPCGRRRPSAVTDEEKSHGIALRRTAKERGTRQRPRRSRFRMAGGHRLQQTRRSLPCRRPGRQRQSRASQ